MRFEIHSFSETIWWKQSYLRVVESQDFFKAQKVDIVGRVDSGSYSVDGMRHRDSSPENGVIFNIINSIRQNYIVYANSEEDCVWRLQETGIVQHLDNIVDDVQRFRSLGVGR